MTAVGDAPLPFDRLVRRLATVSAGLFFICVGGAALLNSRGILTKGADIDRTQSAAWGVAGLIIGVGVLAVPWGRLPRSATLVLPLIAYPYLTVSAVGIGYARMPDAYGAFLAGTFFVLMWLAFSQPRWAVALTVPLIAVQLWAESTTPGSNVAIVPVLLLVVPAVCFSTLSAWTVQALRSAQARERDRSAALERDAMSDPLTRVGSRRAADQLLASLEAGDSLLLLDVDKFKAVNDSFGHPVGDRLLRRIGVCLLSSIRDEDGAARLGGDEFVVVVRGPTPAGAEVADRIQEAWRRENPLATLSVGGAAHELGGHQTDTFERADRALYRCKADGGDRIVIDGRSRADGRWYRGTDGLPHLAAG